MVDHKAGKYFLDWISRHGETADLNEVSEAFAQTCHLAEEDWKNLKSDQARSEVAVAVLDAHIFHDNAHGHSTTVLMAIRNHLLGAATGRPDGLKLPQGMPGAREPINDLYAKVVFTMLWDKHPEERKPLVEKGMKLFDLKDSQVRDIPANTRKLIKNDPHTSRLRALAHEKYRMTGSATLDDYLPPPRPKKSSP